MVAIHVLLTASVWQQPYACRQPNTGRANNADGILDEYTSLGPLMASDRFGSRRECILAAVEDNASQLFCETRQAALGAPLKPIRVLRGSRSGPAGDFEFCERSEPVV